MFFRRKKSGGHAYLQIVENRWDKGKVRQRVIATLGRLDKLVDSDQLDRLLVSGSRFSEKLAVLWAHQKAEAPVLRRVSIGPDLLFRRLWRDLGVDEVLEEVLADRGFEFPVERAVYLTVLHRLFVSGSDRRAEHWRRDFHIPGSEDLKLHHLYRTMAWLGSPLADDAQWGSTGFSPRCEKDRIEEKLFARRRDLFTPLQVVFFDTTSMYFEGEGGSELGRYGKSKDHRPDRKQLVAGAILDGNGTPVCSEIWPGNTADVKTLLPLVDRLRARFGVGEVCVVCDRGMISKKTIEELERRNMKYILGARMRAQSEVKRDVLGRGGSFEEVRGPREKAKDPSPLKVKEVFVSDRRYVLCLNEEQARKDAADREAILAGLKDALKHGSKSLVGNKGYRRFLKSTGNFKIDGAKVKAEARYDGKWVLRTNLDLPTKDVALRYKELWMVEDTFRTMKSILDTRPIFHKCDETIRGHVFCSFLALALQKELRQRLNARGLGTVVEWDRLKRDLVALEEVEHDFNGKTFVVRTETVGDCGRALQAVGAAMPPTVRLKETG